MMNMRFLRKFRFALFALFPLMSCMSADYYQLLTTKPIGDVKKVGDALFYEDANCIISYSFWSKKGSTCIKFENKTDEDIYLDMAASFYFMNDQAFDLYKESTTTKSHVKSNGGSINWGFGITTGSAVSSNSTVVTYPRRLITIPAGMYKIIDETDGYILESIYRDCNLYLWPSKDKVKSLNFTQTDTPYTFGLRLSYYVGQSSEVVRVKNVFYVDKITNYPLGSFKKRILDKGYRCSDEDVPVQYVDSFFFKAPDAFYLRYNPSVLGQGSQYNRKH